VTGVIRWREAMAEALYGSDGFFTRPGNQPAAHFRTSTHASPLFAAALLRLLQQVDTALGHPHRLDLIDVGAGRGELLTTLLDAAPADLAARLHPVAVEVTSRPDDLPAAIGWSPPTPPLCWSTEAPIRAETDQCRREAAAPAMVVACEWLDNVPLDVAQVDPAGTARYVLVDSDTGEETLGDPVTGTDLDWLRQWWPSATPGTRAEIGRPRDEAWAQVLATIPQGLALAVDYGHVAQHRPPLGTLTGFRHGREVAPIPDGSCDLTAHVAMDALTALAGEVVLLTQREALRALGVDGARPPLELAYHDPARYLRRLATAGQAAELTDPSGLGGHLWLLQPVALPHPLPAFMARWPT
jgi:SAM-dependent MidA family methyltransferase